MDNSAAHIAARFVIHFVASAFCYLAALAGYRFVDSRWPYWTEVSVPAVLVFAVAVLREPFDVAHGQSLTKAVFDFISRGGGLAFTVWGIAWLKRRNML